MQYLGGKKRIAKEIANTIAGREPIKDMVFEPFMGGGSVTEQLASHYGVVFATDAHEDLVLMWQTLQTGWIPPDSVSEDEYKTLRHSAPSALRAFAGFGVSFGGKWFGGYARDNARHHMWYAQAAKKHCMRQGAAFRNVYVSLQDYRATPIVPGATVYADPPYAKTTGYSTGSFNSQEFWGYARAWRAGGMKVYVSEYAAPADWTCIAEWTKTRNMAGKDGPRLHTERLFI